MLSYQHAFHAGNHADVLKHLVLCALLRAIAKKNKPFFYLDTHAGNGAYEIDNNSQADEVYALRVTAKGTADTEYIDSGKVSVQETINDYVTLIKPYISKAIYPGSPLIAWDMLTMLAQEKNASYDLLSNVNVHLSELHPSAFEMLKQWLRPSNFHCHHTDGLALLNALTPPKPNRGLVLIDPPYEQAVEYSQLLSSMGKALRKWQNGIYIIWYPLLSPTRIDRLTGQIVNTPKHGHSEDMLKAFVDLATHHKVGLLKIEFAQQMPSKDVGMYGSGMVIFNPPWQVDITLTSVLEWLLDNNSTQVDPQLRAISQVQILVPNP